MKQRILSFLLILCLLAGTIPQLVPAATATDTPATYTGTCGKNVTWSFEADTGIMYISGTGPMAFRRDGINDPWASFESQILSIVIEKGVTSISEDAFSSCGSLKSVTIPNSVTSIGMHAFAGCYNLRSVTIPDSVVAIGEEAFCYCDGLTSINIPKSVVSVGNNAFLDCFRLQRITVDTANQYYCNDKNGVLFDKDIATLIACPGGYSGSYTIPNSVTAIGNNAFESCENLTSVIIPDSVITIGEEAFSYCDQLTSVEISEGVTTIGRFAFHCCQSLSSVNIPSSVTTIEEWAFSHCYNLTSVTIPAGVSTIGKRAFLRCDNLQNITVDAANPYYCNDSYGVLFNKDATTLIACPGGYFGHYTIPNSVITIGEDAFYDCESLISVTIPNSVTSIESFAFDGCDNLRSVNIPNSVTSIGTFAFYYCKNLTSITFPDNITSISDFALGHCANLSSVTIPETVTTIGDHAFESCTTLNYIKIPEIVTSISTYSFYRCQSLKAIIVPSDVTSIDSESFFGCTGLEKLFILNPSCNIYDSKYTISMSKTGAIYGRPGSTAEAYAQEYGFTFYPICECEDNAYHYEAETTEPTCTQDGIITLSCTNCGATHTALAASASHSYEIVSMDKPTCEKEGAVTSSCTVCGHTKTEALSAAKHSYKVISTVEPTCEQDGKTTYTCAGCGDTKTETIPATEHTYETTSSVAPTCTKGGKTTYTCTGCGDTKTETTSATGHSYEVTSTVAPTCEKDGETTCTCTGCGDTKTETTPATGHSYKVTSTVEPTYDQDGEITYTCTSCGATKTEPIPALGEKHNYEVTATIAPTCEWTGLVTYTCVDCGHTKSEIIPATGHSYDDGAITTPATCVSKGVRVYTCTVCGSTKVESIPVTKHQHLLYRNNGDDHSVKCITCPNSYNEPHHFTNGRCVCGAIERILDETVKIYHSLNLASDIAINYAVRAVDLAGYESYFMECVLSIYEGNELLGTEIVTLQPELQGDYYYFTLTGMTALEMNNMVEATLHMEKDGKHYISNTDSYSIATYAYDQLNNEAMPEALRALCANLLRYGAKAQLWKGYRTDALADGAMTEAHKALLGDLESVPFGNNSQILTDIENPVVTWVGKTMSLDSKITVRFVVNTTNYTGDLNDLSLRISFVNINGETETVNLTELTAYNAARNYYAFDFDGLLSAELRSVLRATVYAGDTQLSPTLVYSVDTYGTATTGSLRTLVQAMVSYCDSASEFFAG